MSGERDLGILLRTLSARLDADTYVFATLPDGRVPAGLSPRMTFREAEGVTLILRRPEAEAQGLAHAFPCRMITLEVHSALEAVGLIARIAGALARHGIAVNPVAGYHHDHLFVPEGREAEAMEILARIARTAAGER